MIAPDLETAISAPARPDRGRAHHRAVHRGGHIDRMRHPGFPLARRLVDQEPADPVRRLHGEQRDAQRGLAPALRHGGEFRQGQAGPRASGAGEPLSRRQGAGAGDAEHRQSASGLRHRAGRRRRIARQYHLRRVPRLRAALRVVVGPAKIRGRRPARAGLRLRRLHQDRHRVVRAGDAGRRDGARRAIDHAIAICFSPSARRWWCGRRRDFR